MSRKGPHVFIRTFGKGLLIRLVLVRSDSVLVQVRFVQAVAIQRQLNGGHIVLLGNLAYSAAGEVLNCDCYSVATQAAIDLQADKLFCLTTPDLQPFDLPHWLPISDAERLLTSLMQSKDGDQTEQSSGVHSPSLVPFVNAC